MTDFNRRFFIKQLAIAGVFIGIPKWANAAKHINDVNTQNTNIVRVSINPEPPVLISFANTSGTSVIVSTKVIEGLLEYDENLKPKPQLATEWSVSDDGLTYDFQLRKNVSWHDGEPFTAKDAAFSIEAVKKFHPRGANTFTQLYKIEIVDDHHLRLHLKQAAPYLILALAAGETPILPAHHYDLENALQNPLNNAPIGTGPYKFKEWQRGSHIVYERNPDYWLADHPSVEQLIFRILPDSSTRLNGLQNGEIDLAPHSPIPLSELPVIEKNPGLATTTAGYEDNAVITMLEFNLDHPVLSKLEVRQAIAHAINREQIKKIAFYGYADTTIAPVSKRSFPDFHLDAENPYPFDVDKGNAILDKLGLNKNADGHRISLNLHANPFESGFKRTATYIRSALGRIGIKVILHDEDPGSYIRSVYTNRDFDITVSGVSTMFDPTVGLQRIFYSKNFNPKIPFSNANHYQNPEVDALLAAAAIESDRAKRAELFKQFQAIVIQEIPSIALAQGKEVTIFNKNVAGFHNTAAGVRGNLALLSVQS